MESEIAQEVINMGKLDNCKQMLETAESIIGKNIVKEVKQYTNELDSLIGQMHRLTNNPNYIISNEELENLIIKIPILTYELNNVLMKAGIKEDLAKVIRQNNYNSAYVVQEGTINDKKSAAELLIKEEALLETIWKRSVKVISQKIDIAQELLSACKKILSRRIDEMNIMARSVM